MTVFTERAVKTKNAGFQQEQNERAHCIQSQGERKTSSRITSGCQLSKALLQSLPAACEAASLQCPRVAQNPHCCTSPFTHVTLPRLCSPTRPASVQRPESGPERRVWWGASANPQEGVRPGASWTDEERLLTHRRVWGPGPPGPPLPSDPEAPFLESTPQKSLSLFSVRFVKLVILYIIVWQQELGDSLHGRREVG